MDAQVLIGSSRLPIFSLMSCPSLVCVQLFFGMKSKMSGCSLCPHHIMETHREPVSLALKCTLLCHLLAFSTLT